MIFKAGDFVVHQMAQYHLKKVVEDAKTTDRYVRTRPTGELYSCGPINYSEQCLLRLATPMEVINDGE